MELEYRGAKIDTESQRILEALSERSARASEIASLIGVDDPQQVRYRINRYLQPAGLVTTSGTQLVNGGEATFYSLTEDGEIALEIAPDEFAESHDPRIPLSRDRSDRIRLGSGRRTAPMTPRAKGMKSVRAL